MCLVSVFYAYQRTPDYFIELHGLQILSSKSVVSASSFISNHGTEFLMEPSHAAGTVSVSVADVDFVKKRERVEHWLEDGTPSFLAIAALRHGFAVVNDLTLPAIQR